MVKCFEINCNIRAYFNYKNEKIPIYCKTHKKDDMVDIKHKKCIEENCDIRPIFNYENEKTAIYCSKHKKDDMIDIKHKKCIKENCDKFPSCNYKNEKIPIYCKTHKKDDMIDIINKRCIEENCDKHPNFNFQNEKISIYCKTHKKDDMIDIKNKKCIEKNCDKHPSCNYKNEKTAIYCSSHKKDDMINIISKRCIEKNCDKHPNFNFQNEKTAIYCSSHKKDDMIDIISKKCNCISDNRIYHNNLCFDCFSGKFPFHKKIKRFKQKEQYIVKMFKEDYKDLNCSFDKQISCNSCTRSRPDIYIDLYHYTLHIEIDENQHNGYSCENKRMMELFQALGNRPIIFIRFNPDGEEKIFSFDKLGYIKPTKFFKEKYKILKEKIDFYLDNKPIKEMTIDYLFYE